MSRSNKTEYALLGLLSLEPMSGYDMKAFITRSIGYFWQESYGQIYPALKRLHAGKLVTRKVSGKTGRPDRHIYSITPAGRKHFQKWLETETEPDRLRIELLLKLFFGPMAGPETQKRHVEALLHQQTERLKQFEQVERGMLREHEDEDFHPYWYSTLRFGILVTQARVKWCRETLTRIRKIKPKKDSD